jgi:RNA-directed DNA polymerase
LVPRNKRYAIATAFGVCDAAAILVGSVLGSPALDALAVLQDRPVPILMIGYALYVTILARKTPALTLSSLGWLVLPIAAFWRRQEARGDMIVVRYADDLGAGFEHEGDARRFLDAMRERFEAFSLSLHPDKTRLIEFGRHAAADHKKRGVGRPETFAFLGFTFICGKSRRGAFQLQRKTRRDRMRAKLQEIKAELRQRMHQTIPDQGHWLRQVVTGHFAYYAIPTNSRALTAFRHYVADLWRRTLRRRSQKDGFTWDRMTKLANGWLPAPRIRHPWPDQRFAVKHPR